ncbi:MAG TPA: glycosyltransferase [Candidatus Limnocylindrales bacterium]|nr:glycosyltransferase [Candidatus Limnocylindrales bacterium]
MIWFYWISGLLLAVIWLVPVLEAAFHFGRIADIAKPQWNPPQEGALPSLTIVVPARNEAAAIEPALRSLLRLDYPEYQVIAVNDRSTDSTGEILERLAAGAESGGRLRVVHVHQLPAGWLGKTHAMWLGARQGTGEWILFTDADCVFRSDSLRRALHYAGKTGVDHLVLFPTVLMQTWGERIMIPFFQAMFNFAHRPWRVSDPGAKDHIGVGAFNLVRRTTYEAIGTYAGLRLEVLDDMKLGEAVKLHGFRQNNVFGRDLVTLRWAEGAMGVVRNLGKNLFAYLRFRISLAVGVCFVLLFLGVWPFVGLLLAPGWAKAGFFVSVSMIAATYVGMFLYTGISPLLFLTYPIGAGLFLFATLRSACLAIRDGGITWRGTKYPLEELRKK